MRTTYMLKMIRKMIDSRFRRNEKIVFNQFLVDRSPHIYIRDAHDLTTKSQELITIFKALHYLVVRTPEMMIKKLMWSDVSSPENESEQGCSEHTQETKSEPALEKSVMLEQIKTFLTISRYR